MANKKGRSRRRQTSPINTGSTDTCFTIMPFGGWFDSYYESIYIPAIEAAGLMPCRADDLYRPSTIIHDIWSYTQAAKIILADLSGKNPNVFYELGLAHALAKPAILITESMDDVPFDLRALRVLEYDKNDPLWGEILQEKITSAIKEVVAAPLQSVLPAFLTVKPETKTKTVSEQEMQFLELKREIDLLKAEVIRNRFRTGPRIPSSAARARIAAYARQGVPDGEIVARLGGYGVPTSFVTRELTRIHETPMISSRESPGTASDPEQSEGSADPA